MSLFNHDDFPLLILKPNPSRYGAIRKRIIRGIYYSKVQGVGSTGNVLMTKHILDALGRLHAIGDDDAREILEFHMDRVMEGAEKAGLLEVDLDFLKSRRESVLSLTD